MSPSLIVRQRSAGSSSPSNSPRNSRDDNDNNSNDSNNDGVGILIRSYGLGTLSGVALLFFVLGTQFEGNITRFGLGLGLGDDEGARALAPVAASSSSNRFAENLAKKKWSVADAGDEDDGASDLDASPAVAEAAVESEKTENSEMNKDGEEKQKQKQKQKEEIVKPVEKIILLGERHSGTNWITDHLTKCFGENIKVTDLYRRMKHWFHEEDLDAVPENSAVVVSMFRDPYDWVEAMRVEPHHSHDHVNWTQNGGKIDYDVGWRQQGGVPLDWRTFVTRPWMGRRGPADEKLRSESSSSSGGIVENARCIDGYGFYDAAPCSAEDSLVIQGLGMYKYEFQRDGSERGFPSVVNLRREKILNHLSVANFLGVRAYFPFRFEDLNANGTERLLRSVEEATGLTRMCNATLGKAPVHERRRHLREKPVILHDELPGDFIRWMNKYVDWDVESLVGYSKRQV